MLEYMALNLESKGLKKSCMPGLRFFALVASFLFLVWIPSFFIVMGRSTCGSAKDVAELEAFCKPNQSKKSRDLQGDHAKQIKHYEK